MLNLAAIMISFPGLSIFPAQLSNQTTTYVLNILLTEANHKDLFVKLIGGFQCYSLTLLFVLSEHLGRVA